MKNVLTTLAIVFAVALAVSIDCPVVLADFAGDSGPPIEGGIQATPGGEGISGVCGGEGDPDDLGGGFRSSHGQTKETKGDTKPPVPPLTDVMLLLQRIWMMILR